MVVARFSQETIWTNLQTVQQLSSSPPTEEIISTLKTLLEGDMELQGLMPWSSNYTFLAEVLGSSGNSLMGIYKPGDGERPLWDFPDRTLSLREFTSYLVSQVLGWPKVPPTVLREGPHGLGSLQLFIEAEYEAHYFNMRNTPTFTEDFRKMALFDYVVNNADRKGGHCLKGYDGQIWAIDHGLTFHTKPKLRTVIWEFSDAPIPDEYLADMKRLQNLVKSSELCQVLDKFLAQKEISAFSQRIDRLVSTGQFPTVTAGRNVPYPPI